MSLRFKIIIGVCAALLITLLASRTIFLDDSPQTNTKFLSTLPSKTSVFISKIFSSFKKTPTPAPTFIPAPTKELITPIIIDNQISKSLPAPTKAIPTPVKPTQIPNPTLTPVKKIVSPTITPKISPTTVPGTYIGQGICPTTSTQTYTTIRQNPNKPNSLKFDPSKNPETNLLLRGWYEVNEGKELISRRGDNTGLDPNMPPQISSLFGDAAFPKIDKTYRINAWDYENGRNIPGESATPAYAVHMLGLTATPGQPLYGLKAGRTIDGSHVFLVVYATKNYILMVHANSDVWDEYGPDGYPFYFLDICVDPNLVALYEKNNAEGRNELPGVSTGQVFGYAASNEVKFVIRDTMSFMDTRYKEDWWEYGK